METELPGAVSDVSFVVEYQVFPGAANPALRGKGEFTVSAADPFYRFTGKTRATFGSATTMQFQPDQIWNVTVDGRKVQFETRVGSFLSHRKPFVFFCSTPAEALAAAQLLPHTQDNDFMTTQDFGHKLNRLPAASSPWTSATNLIIAANVVAFVIMGLFGAGWLKTADMRPYVLYVANNGGVTTDGEWWRIVTCMFVHYGALHLLLNMWALFQTGHFVEKLLGRPLFTLAYFGSGIAAGFTSIFWHGDKVWSAGASGAVFGVYGMLLGFMLREKQSIPKPILSPLLKSTLTFAGYNLFFGMLHPQIDNAAHIGGLLGGLALGWLVALPVDTEVRARLWPSRLRLGVVAMVLVTTIGVSLSPRYDYSLREELRLEDINKEPARKEAELVKQQDKAVAVLERGEGSAELERWIQSEALPFYEKWLGQLNSLALDPGKQTERSRRTITTYLQAKLANCRRLSAELRANDTHALARYAEAEKQAIEQARVGRTKPDRDAE